ncbi:TatD family hydrolase [Candidatus Hodarchaeum mangrovi]
MIDSHAHLLPDFVNDVEQLVINAQNSGLTAIINSAIEPKHYNYSRELAETFKSFVYSTYGFAPQKIKSLDDNESIEAIRKIKSLVAIGEIGLDYHWIQEREWREQEKNAFSKFINFGNEMKLPLVIHSRKAEEECISILAKKAEVPVLMHCFAGTIDQAKQVIDLGWLISVPTAVKNRKKHRKITRITPLDFIVVETDTPFLSPFKGRSNEPANIRYAIQEVSLLKDTTFEEVELVTTRNAKKFFKI